MAADPGTECVVAPGRRVQSIAVLDPITGASRAPTQSLRNFGRGVYLRYNLSGPVVVKVSQLCEQAGDAMLNALFFD